MGVRQEIATKFRGERNFTFEEKEIRSAEMSKRSRRDDHRDPSDVLCTYRLEYNILYVISS